MCVFVLFTQFFIPAQLGTVPANFLENVSVGDVPETLANVGGQFCKFAHGLSPFSTVYAYQYIPDWTYQYPPQPIWLLPDPDFLKTILFISCRVYLVSFFTCSASLQQNLPDIVNPPPPLLSPFRLSGCTRLTILHEVDPSLWVFNSYFATESLNPKSVLLQAATPQSAPQEVSSFLMISFHFRPKSEVSAIIFAHSLICAA